MPPFDLENDPIMKSHFEAAGISDDTGSDSNSGNENNDTQTASGEDSNSGTQSGTTDQIEASQGKDVVGQTGNSDKPNGGKKQDAPKEGQGANPPGSLTLQDGTIIKPGAERRLYDNLQNARQQIQQRDTQVQQLNTELQGLRTRVASAEAAAKVFGIEDPARVAGAVRLYKDFNANPVETVKKMLAEMAAAGYDLQGVVQGFDAVALRTMIDQRLGPITQEREAQEQQRQIANEAEQETNQFFGRYPDARQHEQFIAHLMGQHEDLSVVEAYFTVKEWATKNQFDWSQPLGPQIQARQNSPANGQQQQQTNQQSNQSQQQNQQQQQRPQQDQSVPMFQGRGAPEFVERDNSQTPLKHETWDDIIRSSLRESNYRG